MTPEDLRKDYQHAVLWSSEITETILRRIISFYYPPGFLGCIFPRLGRNHSMSALNFWDNYLREFWLLNTSDCMINNRSLFLVLEERKDQIMCLYT